MKIFGRAEKEEADLENLIEVTLVADPEVLREMASFLFRCADAIEEQSDWEHEYFDCNDVIAPAFAVFNPDLIED